ncbi:hypothetical protein SAICODRAFT_94784 [Saitoella complicata NRRL Y-17804]|uniref:DNA polymerase alpha/delta/epsilon subunit B domain-containing protein n=1 Tax=Saitoella complicata (strain BCRC 22490 / CBS 7301 / JCM 7358 / NBRC 10748 / NRRL Y-17804) TaxID=698492 RepID=A0A0E9NLE4_SAICN|nr:uncharacterized protein SAICODRAFT_94784 [Saitoella complicata NRRL Y-17804]ODQ51712.1 hypothetical protein SAICODRAFT_94784 [Saitoella complicata NRRL Y-17804]GAO50669.1 hypothetical protein G7K_4791-t1 [Saitoella complicata NRRL Y-17804]
MSSSKARSSHTEMYESLLSVPENDEKFESLHRVEAVYDPLPERRDGLIVSNRQYRQQYANLYYLRLATLKPILSAHAERKWASIKIAGQKPRLVMNTLNVKQGEVVWIIGTCFMDLPLKPNILEDVAKDHLHVAIPPREKYVGLDGGEVVMLEDESGRIRLVGGRLLEEGLVTGCVIAVLGSENGEGTFEVVDVCLPGMAPQKEVEVDENGEDEWIAVVSGLGLTGHEHENLQTHLLAEYLTGELGTNEDQLQARKISRVIFAGNSVDALAKPSPTDEDESTVRKNKKYGYDASAYNPLPTAAFDDLVTDLASSITVDVMPGPLDPAIATLPQQPLHVAMFPQVRAYSGSTFNAVTNPYWCSIGGNTFFGSSGQTIDDIYKYELPTDLGDKLTMMERTLRWRHSAPTAPDTLWCYPFQDRDPFIMEETPRVYYLGNQDSFDTREVEGEDGQKVRLVSVPRFKERSELVLVNLKTLECEVVVFDVEGQVA